MLACSSNQTPSTPIETLKTYLQAIKKKDVIKMKALLSKGSIKMAEDEAKAQNIKLDDVILRETLFSPNQKEIKVKNTKIDGETATIEVENSFGSFDRIPFVKEDGVWKIAKDKFADEFQKQVEEEQRKAFEEKTPEETPLPDNTNTNSNSNSEVKTNSNSNQNLPSGNSNKSNS
jgi:hypothetical protein